MGVGNVFIKYQRTMLFLCYKFTLLSFYFVILRSQKQLREIEILLFLDILIQITYFLKRRF